MLVDTDARNEAFGVSRPTDGLGGCLWTETDASYSCLFPFTPPHLMHHQRSTELRIKEREQFISILYTYLLE
jgi:hypothetical protein